MVPTNPEIVVAISAHAPELRGTVRMAEGPDRPFMGWLGLLSALQVAVEAANPQEAQDVRG